MSVSTWRSTSGRSYSTVWLNDRTEVNLSKIASKTDFLNWVEVLSLEEEGEEKRKQQPRVRILLISHISYLKW